MSVRLTLTLSYAGFLMVAGFLLIAVVWVPAALRAGLRDHDPRWSWFRPGNRVPGLFIPGQADLWRAFAPKAAIALAFLLVLGC